MSNLPIFDIAGSALQAQSVRMSTLASNLSNADSVTGSADTVYKPLEPIFQAVTSLPLPCKPPLTPPIDTPLAPPTRNHPPSS